MLRIVNVISDSNIGGAGRILLAFLKHYDRQRLDISVVLPTGSALCERLDALGSPYVEMNGLAEQSFSIPAIRKLSDVLRSLKPDIVHTHAAMSARVAARRLGGVKIVYTRHSVFPNPRYRTSFPGKQIFGAINNHYTDMVIAVSPAARDNIAECGADPRKITVIYNGVDPLPRLSPETKRQTRLRYGINPEAFLCGVFARLTPVKGHDYILDAAAILKKDANVTFVIAGTGELEASLRRRASEENLTNVVFTGFVKDSDSLMAALDVQLNASYGTEATSLALLEGLSAGVPAIATDFGGNPYVIFNGVNGFMVRQKDGEDMAAAIGSLKNDKALYEQMAQGALATYAERFTADKMSMEIEKLYYSLTTR